MSGKKWKGLQQDWDIVQLFDNTTKSIVCLTQQEQNIIISALQPFLWATRWLNLPSEQSLELVEGIIAKLMCNQECCDAVLECITTGGGNTTIINIVNNFYFGDKDAPLGEGLSQLNGCNPDVVFGICTGIVDYIDTQIRDAFQILEVTTNLIEIMDIWFSGVPVIGVIVDRVADYIAWFQDNIAENYDAQFTTGLRDEMRCDLFCAWMDSPNCQLSLSDIALIYVNRLGATSGILDTFFDLTTFAFGGFWTGSAIVEIAYLTVIGMLALEDGAIPFLTIDNVYSFTTVVALSSNNPDGDWSILCTDCPLEVWEAYIDFEITDGGFVVDNGWQSGNSRGSWVSGDGWNTVGAVFFSGWAAYANPRLDFSSVAEITGIEMEYNVTVTGIWSPEVDSSILSRSTPTATSAVINFAELAASTGSGTAMIGNPEVATFNAYGIGLSLWNAHRNTSTSPAANGTGRIKSLRIFGKNTPPDELVPYLV